MIKTIMWKLGLTQSHRRSKSINKLPQWSLKVERANYANARENRNPRGR